MAKMKQWTIETANNQYYVTYTPDIWFGNHKVELNGQRLRVNKTFMQQFAGVGDYPIYIGEEVAHLVVSGNKADLAFKGTFLDSKKEYKPFKSIDWWAWLFIAACIAIPVVAIGGFVPIFIGLLGVIFCVRISVSPYTNTAMKLLYCLIITIVCWALFGAFFYAMQDLIAELSLM